MLPERRDVGRALTPDKEAKLLDVCRKSPQPSWYTAVVIFCQHGIEERRIASARWSQVNFLNAEFQVGKPLRRKMLEHYSYVQLNAKRQAVES
jgi:hypothetical protein